MIKGKIHRANIISIDLDCVGLQILNKKDLDLWLYYKEYKQIQILDVYYNYKKIYIIQSSLDLEGKCIPNAAISHAYIQGVL